MKSDSIKVSSGAWWFESSNQDSVRYVLRRDDLIGIGIDMRYYF